MAFSTSKVFVPGGISLMVGDIKSDLVILARQTAVELSQGKAWLGLIPADLKTVLYLDFSPFSVPHRPDVANRSEQGDIRRLTVVRREPINLTLKSGIKVMTGLLEDHRPEVVIADGLGDIMPKILGPKVKESLKNLRVLANGYQVSFVLLHELIKANWQRRSPRINDVRGHGHLGYYSDNIVALVRGAGGKSYLHFPKLDHSPIQVRTPMELTLDPGPPETFVPSGPKKKEWQVPNTHNHEPNP